MTHRGGDPGVDKSILTRITMHTEDNKFRDTGLQCKALLFQQDHNRTYCLPYFEIHHCNVSHGSLEPSKLHNGDKLCGLWLVTTVLRNGSGCSISHEI